MLFNFFLWCFDSKLNWKCHLYTQCLINLEFFMTVSILYCNCVGTVMEHVYI